MNTCYLCPRACGVDRVSQKGFCQMGEKAVVARAGLHFWEEPCISGTKGSGTIFFSGCSLKCVYCQNYEISHKGFGKKVDTQRLIEIYQSLENQGAHNINLVNPTHFSKAIIESLQRYQPKMPVVYNCSGYEKVDTLRKFEGLIDVYLTDLKYVDDAVAKKYSGTENYFDYASKAILEMQRQIPENVFDEAGIMQKGLIIRHLVLPGNISQTQKVLLWIHENLPNKTVISLMSQYIPCGKAAEFKEINRRLTSREYDKACDMMFEFGFENGYIQDLMSAKETYIPVFDLEGV